MISPRISRARSASNRNTFCSSLSALFCNDNRKWSIHQPTHSATTRVSNTNSRIVKRNMAINECGKTPWLAVITG